MNCPPQGLGLTLIWANDFSISATPTGRHGLVDIGSKNILSGENTENTFTDKMGSGHAIDIMPPFISLYYCSNTG
jgi:hypothetical protein